jgi:endonuclease-8
MDQNIFSGLGNIMKNEILFNLSMHPRTKVEQLTAARQRALVAEAESYAWRFYEWKKINQLKRNWKIMRKRICPTCGRKVKKQPTGKLQRLSHFCSFCQKKR